MADIIATVTATREFDWGYVHEQFAELWIADYAEELLAVSRAIYRGDKLTDAQQDMVFRMVLSGTYGNPAEAMHICMRRAVREGRSPRLAELRWFFLVGVCQRRPGVRCLS